MNINNTKKKSLGNLKIRNILTYIFVVLEALFAFRLVFKVLGANPQSGFVAFIYSITKLFLAPFTGIFKMVVSNGIETQAVLEPTVIIAMVVYAALCWAIVQLIKIGSNLKESDTL